MDKKYILKIDQRYFKGFSVLYPHMWIPSNEGAQGAEKLTLQQALNLSKRFSLVGSCVLIEEISD